METTTDQQAGNGAVRSAMFDLEKCCLFKPLLPTDLQFCNDKRAQCCHITSERRYCDKSASKCGAPVIVQKRTALRTYDNYVKTFT